jgi:hypothetical protein
LCEVEGGRLQVTGTDNEVTVRTYLEVEGLEDGATVIPAKLAADAVRKLPTGAVSITASDGEVEITGNGPRFRLRELSVGDFPTIDDKLPAETIDVVERLSSRHSVRLESPRPETRLDRPSPVFCSKRTTEDCAWSRPTRIGWPYATCSESEQPVRNWSRIEH